jgi:hypothetical protein
MLSQVVRIRAAAYRARAFETAGTINPFDAPTAQRSALHEYRQRTPRPPPGTTVAIHATTDGPAILQRVLGEDDRRRLVERVRKQKWRARRSPDQIANYRERDREWRRDKRAGRRLPPSAG